MDTKDRKGMNILAIEPMGTEGHLDFNASILRVLAKIGNVTFAAPRGYLDGCEVFSRVDIPYVVNRYPSRFGVRWTQIQILDLILRKFRLEDYQAIFFLCYETISFTLRWPRGHAVFLFDHNNIDDARGSRIKTFFYRHLPTSAVHLVFQKHMKDYVEKKLNGAAVQLPHPYYLQDGTGEEKSSPSFSHDECSPRVVFSPSASTPQSLQHRLVEFAEKHRGSFYVICKGNAEKSTPNCSIRPFFKDYGEIMRNCHFVFLGKPYNFRVSGVAYEALSYGKPVVLWKSLFAQELQEQYPNLAKPIGNLEELVNLKLDRECAGREHARFLKEHGFPSLLSGIVGALRSQAAAAGN